MIKEAISKLTGHESLTFDETEQVFEEIFEHKATVPQITGVLIALKMKGETGQEIAAAAKVVRKKANKVNVRGSLIGMEDISEPVMDTCGTGGSGINKFNISTAVSFVVSASGVKVAKHGNRAMSSTCGSADAFEAIGIKIDLPPAVMEKAIKQIGIGFLYAPLYHPALKEVAQIRKDLGVRTIFNVLGPLCNPAFASHHLLGVYSDELVPIIAGALKSLGVTRAFVVCGKDLKDEVSLTGKTLVSFVNNNKILKLELRPSDFGLKKIKLKDLEVRDAKMSAKIIEDIFGGKKGAPRDMVLANAACCFYILGKAKNLKDGVSLAAQLIDSGKAKEKLSEFKRFVADEIPAV